MGKQNNFQDALEIAKTGGEMTMRESPDVSPDSIEQLTEYVTALTTRSHDYGTSAAAMMLAAEAAFNYVASVLGCTGFQASCADIEFFRRSRNIEGPFAIIKGTDMLYPQYDIRGRVEEHLATWAPWAAEQAQKLLDEKHEHAVEPVVEHWKKLVAAASCADNKDGE